MDDNILMVLVRSKKPQYKLRPSRKRASGETPAEIWRFDPSFVTKYVQQYLSCDTQTNSTIFFHILTCKGPAWEVIKKKTKYR